MSVPEPAPEPEELQTSRHGETSRCQVVLDSVSMVSQSVSQSVMFHGHAKHPCCLRSMANCHRPVGLIFPPLYRPPLLLKILVTSPVIELSGCLPTSTVMGLTGLHRELSERSFFILL